jgi:hypothetical protein
MEVKKTVIISAINFFEGGPLSVLSSCLYYLNGSDSLDKYRFIALVHSKDLFKENEYPNIELIEFPKSRSSYFYRLYYEYIYFRKFAIDRKVYFWFSLHDITPNLRNVSQAVYCHNPSPFNKLNFSDIYLQPTQFLFRLFYKYLYQINIKKNAYVIVQQLWIKERFNKLFDLNQNKIIISLPQISEIPAKYFESKPTSAGGTKMFIFPAFPRPFKNFELICEAVNLVLAHGDLDFKVVLTISGSENKYANYIYEKYKHIKNIEFVGLLQKEEVYNYYSMSDCLIFPSKLETWGLPISEYKQFDKPMLVADLPYAKETVGNYNKVSFFSPDQPKQLAQLIVDQVEGLQRYNSVSHINYEQPVVNSWKDLFDILLKNQN